jgi:hypothetical protein
MNSVDAEYAGKAHCIGDIDLRKTVGVVPTGKAGVVA